MSKNKSSFVGFVLAVFTGPLSFLYVGKWKKTLLFFPLIFIPYINIIAYIIILFSIVKDVRNYNKEKVSEVRYNLIVCKCSAQNKAGSKFCSNCGKELTKVCKSCKADISKVQPYCNFCGFGFQEQIKKRVAIKKTAVIALTSVITLLLFSLTFLVAVEQQEAKKYIDNVKLTNFEFPEKISTNKFHIHYELSEKRLPGVKGLKTFIEGNDVYTKDSESVFDGRNIEWIVHAKKKGLVYFNVTLYDDDRLLDKRHFSVRVTKNAANRTIKEYRERL